MVHKILLFLLIPTICFGAEINKKNYRGVESFESDGKTYYMVNIDCKEPNTSLDKFVNNTLIKCNINNCVIDDSNKLIQSNYLPEPLLEEEEETKEELKARIVELETTIESKDIIIAEKEALLAASKTLEVSK